MFVNLKILEFKKKKVHHALLNYESMLRSSSKLV